MFEIECQGINIRIVGDGAQVHVDVDALLPSNVAVRLVKMILQAQKSAATSGGKTPKRAKA